MTYNAFRKRGSFSDRTSGSLDNKSLSLLPPFSGIKLWLDFSDISTLFTDSGSTNVSSDGDLIYQVNDKSGNGFNATQSTSAERPLYKAAIQNSKSVGRFDGSDDSLQLPNLGIGGDISYTIVVVFCPRIASASPKPIVSWGEVSSHKYVKVSYTSSDENYLSSTNFSYTHDHNISYPNIGKSILNNFGVAIFVQDSSLVVKKCYYNGNIIGSNYPSSALNITDSNYVVGGDATDYLNGDLAEIILYDHALKDKERKSLEKYINNKWKLYNVNIHINEWWLANGEIDSSDCLWAYQSVGVASYEESKVNLVNQDTFGLSLYNSAPSWSPLTGWTFNGSNQALTSSYNPKRFYPISAFVKFSSARQSDSNPVFGWHGNRFYMAPYWTANSAYGIFNTFFNDTPGYSEGVMGISGLHGYYNGNLVTTRAGINTDDRGDLFIGGRNASDSINYFEGNIQAVSFYPTILIPQQIEALSDAMNEL